MLKLTEAVVKDMNKFWSKHGKKPLTPYEIKQLEKVMAEIVVHGTIKYWESLGIDVKTQFNRVRPNFYEELLSQPT